MCVINYKTTIEGKTFDGVLNEIQFETAVTRCTAKAVFIADLALSVESRKNIKTLCEGKNVEFQDYTSYFSNLTRRVSLIALLETTKCPEINNSNNESKEYQTVDESLKTLTDCYAINSISANGSKLVIDLKENKTEAYAGYEAWLQKYKEETGEEVSNLWPHVHKLIK